MKIAMICAEYPPQSGPGPARMSVFARGLAEREYDPVIFVTQSVPGKFAKQWFGFDGALQIDDKLVGTLSGRGRDQSLLEKVINFVVPMEPRWTLSLFNLQKTFKLFVEEEKPDLIFTTSNPLASAVGGMMLKHGHKIPLIVEFRDPWTQNPIRVWPTYIHFLVESWLERRVLRVADAVIMNTPTARSNLLVKYSWLDGNKVHAISHGFDGDLAESADNGKESKSKSPLNRLKIAYAGGFYMRRLAAQGGFGGAVRAMLGWVKSGISYDIGKRTQRSGSTPETILRAVAKYNISKAENMPRVEMHFIGTSSDQLQSSITAMNLEGDVLICPRVHADDVRDSLQPYDLLFLTNPALPNSPFVGTKTFDYLGAGRSIVAELNDGDQARIILESKAGWVVPPESDQSIVDIFKMIATGAEGLISPDLKYISLFERKHQINDLIKVIEQSLGYEHRYPVISQGYREIVGHNKVEGT